MASCCRSPGAESGQPGRPRKATAREQTFPGPLCPPPAPLTLPTSLPPRERRRLNAWASAGPGRARARMPPGGGKERRMSPFSPRAGVRRENTGPEGGIQLFQTGASRSHRRRAGTRILPLPHHDPRFSPPTPAPLGETAPLGRRPGPGVPPPSALVRLGVPGRPRPREGRSGRDHLQRWRGGRRGGAEGRGRPAWSSSLCLGREKPGLPSG